MCSIFDTAALEAGRVSKHADHRNQRRPRAAAGQLRGQGGRGFLAQRHAGTEAPCADGEVLDEKMWETPGKPRDSVSS